MCNFPYEFPLVKHLQSLVYFTYPENHLIECVFMGPKHAFARINIGEKIHLKLHWLNLLRQTFTDRTGTSVEEKLVRYY